MANTVTPLEEKKPSPETEKTPKALESAKSKTVFPNGMSSEQIAFANASCAIGANIDTLKCLQDINPTGERTKQIVDLERQRGRNGRFAYLRSRGAGTDAQKAAQKEILKTRETLEDLRTSDFLLLKSKGVDLMNLLLVSDTNPTGSVTRDAIKEADKFIVNFGQSKDLKNSIGAGDIFPPSVNTIMVNGQTGIRMDIPTNEYPNVKRPGYYNIVTKVYIPIYDDDRIEIVSIKKLSNEELKNSQMAMDERLRTARIRDMVESMDLKGDKWREDFTLLPEDESLIKDAEMAKKDRAERKKRYEHLFGMGMTESMFRQYFSDTINTHAKKYDIPPELVVTLIRQESKFDFNAVNKDTGAFGFGQHVPYWKSWEEGEKFMGMDLDKEDPFHQVIATIGYLAVTKNRLKGSTGWPEAVVAYHTGVGFSEANLAESKKKNPGVAKLMLEDSVDGYKKAAAEYYQMSKFTGVGYSEMQQSTDISGNMSWANFIGMPAEKSENDITLCSRTAQKNARLFGITLPRGDALNARSGYSTGELLNNLSEVPANSNVLDVFMKSGSVYGHRCIAIKNKEDNQWYVLDPYISGEKPVLLSTYASKDKIVNLVAHQASKVFAPKLLAVA